MHGCRHEFVPSREGVWLPDLDRHTSGLQKFQYCRKCGLVRVKGDGKGKKLGFFFNLLGSIPELREVQRRLISKELASNELFTDHEGSYLHYQIKNFIKIVTNYSPNTDRRGVLDLLARELGKYGHRTVH